MDTMRMVPLDTSLLDVVDDSSANVEICEEPGIWFHLHVQNIDGYRVLADCSDVFPFKDLSVVKMPGGTVVGSLALLRDHPNFHHHRWESGSLLHTKDIRKIHLLVQDRDYLEHSEESQAFLKELASEWTEYESFPKILIHGDTHEPILMKELLRPFFEVLKERGVAEKVKLVGTNDFGVTVLKKRPVYSVRVYRWMDKYHTWDGRGIWTCGVYNGSLSFKEVMALPYEIDGCDYWWNGSEEPIDDQTARFQLIKHLNRFLRDYYGNQWYVPLMKKQR